MERFKENNYVTSHFFSKIELFVIGLVIALVVLIAVPKAKIMLKKIQINSAIDTAYTYKENISNFYMSRLLLDTSFELNGTYTVNNGYLIDELENQYDIMLRGNKPTSGYLTYENNKLVNGCIIINGYAVNIDNETMNFVNSCDVTNAIVANL